MTAAHAGPASRDRHRIRLASGVLWERLTTLSEPGIEFLQVTYEVGGASSPPDAFQRHPGTSGATSWRALQVRIGFDEYVLEPGDAISHQLVDPAPARRRSATSRSRRSGSCSAARSSTRRR